MFRIIWIPLVLMMGIWGVAWRDGRYDQEAALMGHVLYFFVFVVMLVRIRPDTNTATVMGALVIGLLSMLIVWHPWIGSCLLALAVMAAAGIDYHRWWTAPQRDWSTYEHPTFGTCIEENVSPRELSTRAKKARQS